MEKRLLQNIKTIFTEDNVEIIFDTDEYGNKISWAEYKGDEDEVCKDFGITRSEFNNLLEQYKNEVIKSNNDTKEIKEAYKGNY